MITTPFQFDHIIAQSHGGETTADNLALACFHCNNFKGPNLAGIDPVGCAFATAVHGAVGPTKIRKGESSADAAD